MTRDLNLIPNSYSFLGFPSIEIQSLEDYDIGILGIPSDLGATEIPGCRFGPRDIRIASHQYTGYLSGLGIDISNSWIGDLGDLKVPSSNVDSFVRIAKGAYQILSKYQKPIVSIGGDHLTTFSAIAGLNNVLNKPPAILWIDAHLDFDEEYPTGVRYSHATVLNRLNENKYIDSQNSVVIGYRGYASHARAEDEASRAGINIFSARFMRKRGIWETINQIQKILSNTDHIYISVDIDALDCAYAPGTGVHEPGGLAPWELIEIIRTIDLPNKIVGSDVVEVNPLRDSNGSTCSTAAVIVLELLGLILKKRLLNNK